MITNDQRQNIKAVPITSYLAGKGILPVLQTGGEYCYFSPFHDERTPSFFVNCAANVYKDFSVDEKGGDNIKLVTILDKCDFIQAIKILQNVDDSFEIELKANLPASPQYQSFVKSVIPLRHKALLNYIAVDRCIPLANAKKYLSEVNYTTSKGDFFSLGFKNESGGFELRNQKFKGCIGKKDISIRGSLQGDYCFVFEGFINFLSFISDRQITPGAKCCFIILNSVSLVGQIPNLSNFEIVHLFLDNDEAGKRAMTKIVDANLNAYDAAGTFHPNHKDYNDFFKAKIARI